jgi:hypothetical protein
MSSSNSGIHLEYKPRVPPDLELEFSRILAAASRNMSVPEKLQLSGQLFRRFTDRIKADILAEHPSWSPVQRHRAFLEYMLGPDAPPPDFDLSHCV